MLVSCIIATEEEKRKTRIRTYVKALAKDSAVRCMANFVFFIASFAHAIRLVLHMLFFESIPRTRQWKKQRNSFDKTLPGGERLQSRFYVGTMLELHGIKLPNAITRKYTKHKYHRVLFS